MDLNINDIRADMPNFQNYKDWQRSGGIFGIAVHHSATVNPLEERLGHLQQLDGQVGGHMPAHQEQDRRRPPGPHHWVMKPPRLAQVTEEIDHGKQVPQQPVQEGNTQDGLEILAAEQLHRGPHEEPGCREGYHDEKPETEES